VTLPRSFAARALLTGAAAALAGCGAEPCFHSDTVPVARDATPFADGTPVFAACKPCPVLTDADGVPGATGPATVCRVQFSDARAEAFVACFYGPGGTISTSLANDAVKGVPALFDHCRGHCPAQDALHGCTFTADDSGVIDFRCNYGHTCG
jgi:hypothetical protein